jgi:hypothetical protein
MNASAIFARQSRAVFIAGLATLVLLAAGCKMEGGYARGLFSGYVIDKTEEEVREKAGQPDAVDASIPNTVKWIYKKKTFDPENSNLVDNETILIFQKDPVSGKLKVSEIVYN